MAKKKDSIALFELISKGQDAQHLPGWMDTKKQDDSSAGHAATAERSAIPPRPVVPVDAALEARRAPHLELSLSYTHSLVLILAVVVLLVFSFMLGRATAPSASPAEDEAPQQNGQVSAGLAQQQAAATTKLPERVRGKYYLVIQDMLGMSPQKLTEAQDIINFLAQNDVPAEVIQWGDRYIVWSLQSVDSPDTEQAKNMVAYVEQVGRRYKAQGGRYDFKQNKSGAWFMPFQGYQN